jgi:hypothetical protein
LFSCFHIRPGTVGGGEDAQYGDEPSAACIAIADAVPGWRNMA